MKSMTSVKKFFSDVLFGDGVKRTLGESFQATVDCSAAKPYVTPQPTPEGSLPDRVRSGFEATHFWATGQKDQALKYESL